ncbi:hypothetical protein H8356DRAFT_1422771 [Neocallimastix lanati (nom. inval.)]|nr:hypothetical protein H8356DRAFT_1422771 [Neocallimastix sp. JGI-2020a]
MEKIKKLYRKMVLTNIHSAYVSKDDYDYYNNQYEEIILKVNMKKRQYDAIFKEIIEAASKGAGKVFKNRLSKGSKRCLKVLKPVKFTNRYPISNILKKTNIWSKDIWISETKKKKKNGRIFVKLSKARSNSVTYSVNPVINEYTIQMMTDVYVYELFYGHGEPMMIYDDDHENLLFVKTEFNENHIKWSTGTTIFLIQIQIHANKNFTNLLIYINDSSKRLVVIVSLTLYDELNASIWRISSSIASETFKKESLISGNSVISSLFATFYEMIDDDYFETNNSDNPDLQYYYKLKINKYYEPPDQIDHKSIIVDPYFNETNATYSKIKKLKIIRIKDTKRGSLKKFQEFFHET